MTADMLFMAAATIAAPMPLQLHPQNPHYFLFRGKPTIIITSGEHYGAVLNPDFDYVKYLDTLHRDGLNNTRTFTGVYCESSTSFGISHNTLAPGPGRLLCPWARSTTPGYAGGGNKFDLTRFDDAYFARLRDFMTHASRDGVIVEMNLFCPFYDDSQWDLSPMKSSNNVNGVGDVPRTEAYSLDHPGGLRPFQEALVRKIVTELRDFDNLYYEIANEPYWGNMPPEWQRHISALIAETEKPFGHRHLVSQNIANDKALVTDPDPNVSILNFHYAFPPATVGMNYGLDLALGDNETGFRGTGDETYRKEAWAFILAGGALFNHLDYSFVAGHEDGSFVLPDSQPGGGTPALRQQFSHLATFIHGFDFLKMKPAPEVVKDAGGVSIEVLAEAGKQYAAYLYRELPATPSAATIALDLPAGNYRAEWVNVLTGKVDAHEDFHHGAGPRNLTSPPFGADLALRLRSR